MEICSLKNSSIFTGKHLCPSLFLKLQALKIRLRHKCFSVNFAKSFRTLFLYNTSGRVLFSCIAPESCVYCNMLLIVLGWRSLKEN